MAVDPDTRTLDAVRLLAQRLHPAATVLFGSRSTGRERPDSDMDLGVLCGGDLPDPFAVAGLRTEIEEIVGRSVDLVVLDSASPILAMEVLRSHRLLALRDPEAFENFTVRKSLEYFDLKQVRAPIESAILTGYVATTDVALVKLASIDRCLERIRSVTRGDPEAVNDLDVEEIVVLNLQRAIQATVDLASHVIAGRSWGLPDSHRAHFRILVDHKVIDPGLGSRLESMVGFRNIAVHEYDRIDRGILKSILSEHLVDLSDFARAVKGFLA